VLLAGCWAHEARVHRDDPWLYVHGSPRNPVNEYVFPEDIYNQKKMEKLIKEFNELNDSDAALPLDERYGTTVVMAIRQWNYGVFEHLRR